MDFVTLSNGVKMPQIGYGVFLIDNAQCERLVLEAIDVGYRHIDTAQAYYNEEGVGAAVAKCGVAREELFITTKVWIADAGYEKACASIDESLKKLQTPYVDLLLVHQPFGDYYGTYNAIIEAYKAGKTRAIGVSNFYGDRLADICRFGEVVPMVDQLETHVFSQRKEMREIMQKHGVALTAWAPLAQGKNKIFTHPVLTAIGKEHSKSASQVALRFLVQNGVTVIPKSSNPERMKENFEIFDFELSVAEMTRIEALDTGENLIFDHQKAQNVEIFFDRFGL